MVFEHIAAFFVDKFLGNYIEDFDSHQLKLHLWKGDIILENVHLKTNALNNLNVPIEIQTGFLEKLRLHIPWKHLYSHPTKVELDGLYLVVSPKTDVNDDPERREQEEYESKMNEVRKVEEFRQERERYELNQQAPHHKDTFFERLQFHILRNLEISIKNIHIALEDRTTKSYPFQIGITLASATLHTTNSEWEDVESKDDSKIIYKLGEINQLSIYWNSNVPSRLDLTNEDMIVDLKSGRHQNYPKWNYILQPLNARAKLKIAKTAQEQDFQQPVLEAKIELDQIYLNINRNQYSDLLDLLEFQDYLTMKSRYIKYHDLLTIHQEHKLPVRRWKFAYTAIVNEYVRPRLAAFRWETIKTNLERYKEYRHVYLKVLLHHASRQERKRAQELEKLIDVFNLIYIRRTADIEYKKRKIEEKDMSWWDKLSDWWNSYPHDEGDAESRPSDGLTLEEKQEFYRAIGYRENQSSDQVAYPEEYIDMDVSLGLNLLQVNVWFNTDANNNQMKWIARASLFDTEFQYQHRPAKDDFQMTLDLDSFEMLGNETSEDEQDTLNLCGPILIQPFEQSPSKGRKLLHVEFETHPLHSQVDYRLVAKSKPLQIIYHAATVNRLIECFLPDRHHDLEGIKQAAISLYTDIKHRTQFLLSENLKRITDLDINVDLKSIYFVLPERGHYTQSSSSVCVDLGRLTFQGGQKNIEGSQPDDTYVPLKIQLTNLSLLYLNRNEHWQEFRLKKDTPAHFIKPITVTLDVFKLIHIDQSNLPIWKAHGHIDAIETQLSDSRIIGCAQMLQSIPLPQSGQSTQTKAKPKEKKSRSKEKKSTKQTYQTIEQMTPVKKILHEQETQVEKTSVTDANEQRVQVEADLHIPKIEILFQRALIESSDYTEDFCRLSILSINASGKVKAYDIEFRCSLEDFNVKHEQFETADGNRLYLLSRSNPSKDFLTINGLLTSPSNPSFAQAPYNSVENRISFDLSKTMLIVQLEALISILQYQKQIMAKISPPSAGKAAPPAPPPPSNDSAPTLSDSSSFQVDFHLEEISLLIGNNYKQILYVQLKEFSGYVAQTHLKIAAHLALNDFRVIDPQGNALYPLIIGKVNSTTDLIRFDLALFHSSKKLPAILQEKDSFIKGHIEKLNVIFLYKHVDLLMALINAFQAKKETPPPPPPPPVPSDQASFPASLLQKYQEQSLQFHLDLTFNAPQVLIPVNSYSREGLLIDLGKLTMQTDASDQENPAEIEEHRIRFENVSINRIALHQGQVINHRQFVQCSPFITLIQRHLNPKHLEDANQINIKTQWDTITMKLGKSDYAFINQILQQNFKEKFFHKLPQHVAEAVPVTSSSPPSSSSSTSTTQPVPTREKPISFQIKWNFQLKEISLTLYLDEPTLQEPADETTKFVTLTIQTVEVSFEHTARSHYQGALQIRQFYADDVSQNKSDNALSRLMNKGFDIDTHAPFLTANVELKKNHQTVHVELESFNLLVSANLINAVKEFAMYQLPLKPGRKPREILAMKNDLQLTLPAPAKSISQYQPPKDTEEQKPTSVPSAPPAKPAAPSDVETKMNVVVKPSRLILIEDPKNENSNCLALNIEMNMNLFNQADETKLSITVTDLSFNGASFEQLKQSKWKYSVLQPSNINVIMVMNSSNQKIDVELENLTINIDPALIRTFVTLSKSLTETPKVNPNEEREQVNVKTIFSPRPFKDSSFWFIEDEEEQHELMEERDLLEMTTGSPSDLKKDIEERNKEKENQPTETRSQQLIVNLKIIEVRMELGEGAATRPVFAACLSNIFADIENWSSDLTISSYVEIELALFNDNLLAWEPLIEPVIDHWGNVQSPWAITCETISGEQGDNEDQNRFLMTDSGKDTSEPTEKGEDKENGMNIASDKAIIIRAEHLLNVTFTKTTLTLFQSLSKMFNDAYEGGFGSDADEEQSILSIHNRTGYDIIIDDIHGIEFPKDYQGNQDSITLKGDESISMTVPAERLSATHLPAISEQVAKRKQQFQVQIKERKVTVDINQTWRRVYELSDSQNPQWPMQLLVDSHIHKERRRVILSSIIKVSNRTLSPLIILDADAVEQQKYHSVAKIDPNDEHYLPIDLLYSRTTPRLYFTIEQDENNVDGGPLRDFISFDWSNEQTSDRVLRLNNNKLMHCVVFKQDIESYSENTDEPNRKSFNILVKLALHVMNLLPIPIQCAIDNLELVDLTPSQLYHSISGHKKSILRFKIPSYNNATWLSDPIDLNTKGHGIHNEHLVELHDVLTNETLRMVLRVDTYRGSYRASFYSPFWVVNATDLKFQMKIENEKTFVDVVDPPYFICPKKFRSDSHKQKGHIRLFSIEEDETISQWSEGFSLDVIKSTGMASCKVTNDRTYMVCIDIVTCSFGMTKIITLAPSTAIVNNSSFDLQVSENISESETDTWKTVTANQIVPYWPKQIKEGVMYVRYLGNSLSSSCFSVKDKHRTLLRMNDGERPALHVEVTVTDFDGYRINFGDYKIGDAPLLIVNSLTKDPVTFCQIDDVRSQMLPPQYYVYYTWSDPFKPQELILSCNGSNARVQLNPACGVLDKNAEDRIYYATFHDGPQTVLLIAADTSIIEAVSDMPSMSEKMKNYIQLSFRSIGISIINDISRDDLFYITINPSPEIWTEKRRFSSKPLSKKMNQHLDDEYKKYVKAQETHTDGHYEIDKNRHVAFDENHADIWDDQGHRVRIQRESLDGLWLGFAWSTNNQAIHVKINHIQIDNQLQITLFPTILHPMVSKANATDIPGKPFIELSVFKSQSPRSNTVHIKYLKLLVQEFYASVDQGLILAIMHFVQEQKNPAAPSVDMSADMKRIDKPLETIIRGEGDNSSPETKVYFDNLHLSPLKIHVSFSMHGAKADEQLLAEYPLVDFLLQILNVAEVQDVILKLNYYERKNDRYSINRLTQEIANHYQNQFLKQLHVVVLGLDVLGNPFGVLRGVAEGVESLFYEPYQGAMEGPVEFIEGVATGTKNFVGSVVGGAAGALSKVTSSASKGLATLTLDHRYQNIRIQRKELQAQTTPEIVASGKNTLKDFIQGVKGVVKKPVKGAKQRGTTGFVKGLGKGFLGLVGRPASGVADLTSASFKLIKKVATSEEIIHRIRPPRHIGRDGIVRPSIAHETFGYCFFHQLIEDKATPNEGYIAHIEASSEPHSFFFATTKRILFFTESSASPNNYQLDWEHHYKEIKGSPVVKFEPNFIEITLKETNSIGMTKKDSLHIRVVPYDTIGEARYVVDKIIETMTILEV